MRALKAAVIVVLVAIFLSFMGVGSTLVKRENSTVEPTPAASVSAQVGNDGVPQGASGKDAPLFNRWYDENDICAGSEDERAVDEMCTLRAATEAKLRVSGWCWSYEDWRVVRADYQWHRCSEMRPPLAQRSNIAFDAKLLDDKYADDAQAACSAGADDYLQSKSKFAYSWDPSSEGLFGVRFDQYATDAGGDGVLTLISNRAKLQNELGAYQRIELRCDFDTESGKVISYKS